MSSSRQQPRSHLGIPAAERKIIMAVDFGTTFSGLAWAQTRKPDLQTPVNQWPDATSGGLEGVSSDKVPTEIEYDGNNYKWGFQISESSQRHQWFKLGLDTSQRTQATPISARFPDPKAAPPGYNLSNEKLVTDYLTALRKHAEQILRYKLPQSALKSTAIEYVITVPAIWTDIAQDKTRKCAENAGMGLGSALHIISEPEAAALYALDALDPHNLEIGDTFVLCDAGGGTVDLISYRITALRPLLAVTEVSPGSGSLCGSSFLNRGFQDMMRSKFKNVRDWGDDVLEEANKRFESVVKRSFRGLEEEEFQVPVPGIRDNDVLGVKRGRFVLKGSEVKSLFEPIVKEIVKLVLEQIRSTNSVVKAVLLVGGFGQSAYLRDSIRAAIGKVELMQSPNGWTAVVRGALMKGLATTSPTYSTVKISGRRSRKHYGILSSKSFDAGIHDDSRKYWSAFYGVDRIDTMDWFIRKGEIVEEDSPNRLHYQQQRVVNEARVMSTTVSILVCRDPQDEGAPMYRDGSVTRLVKLEADLSQVPLHKFPTIYGKDNILYYLIHFEVEITFMSAYTKYELIHNGINYGAVSAEYV